jgi:hypothetical protein
MIYAKLSDTKAAGTSGGTFTSGAWQTRDLNTEDSDADAIVSISANQFTLVSGTYITRIRCPAYQVDRHQARLRNTTDSSTTLVGASGFASAADNGCNVYSEISGRFTIASSKTFEIQHQCTSTSATYGYGVEANLGLSEVYTTVELWKIA